MKDPLAFIRSIPPEQLAATKRQLDKHLAERSLYHFVKQAWKWIDSSQFLDSWAIEALCVHLEAVARGEIRFLLANYPPRCAKTNVASICFPVWVWIQKQISVTSGPQVRFLSASYGQDLSLQAASAMRQLINSPWFQENWGKDVILKDDQNTKSDFANTKGGKRQATSITGRLLGFGGDIVLCFPGYENVWTESGPVPIQKIVEQRLPLRVWSYDIKTGERILKPIVGWYVNPSSELVRVHISDGSHTDCTPNHEFWTKRGWIAAQELTYSDMLPNAPKFNIAAGYRSPLFIEKIGHVGNTYCINVADNHTFYVGEGKCIVSNCDDPHNTEAVESEAERENVMRGWRELSTTRLNDPKKSALIVIMQRLHEQDVSGEIIAHNSNGEWVHLMIPLEHDRGRHCVTYIPGDDEQFWEDPRDEDGELMWPERFGPAEVEKLKSGLGPYMASGRLQQMPTPAGGGIIKKDWWQLWEGPLDANGKEQFPEIEFVLASADTAYTEKKENDYSAMTVWGLWRKNGVPKLILLNAWQKRLTLHGPPFDPSDVQGWNLMDESQKMQLRRKNWGLVEWINYTCTRFSADKLIIEAKASGMSVGQEMRRLYRDSKFGVELINPKSLDKVARTHAIVPMFTDSMIYAPDRDWADMLIEQSGAFPKGAHDDLHDSMTQALRWLRDNGIALRREEHTVDEEALKEYRPQTRPLYPV